MKSLYRTLTKATPFSGRNVAVRSVCVKRADAAIVVSGTPVSRYPPRACSDSTTSGLDRAAVQRSWRWAAHHAGARGQHPPHDLGLRACPPRAAPSRLCLSDLRRPASVQISGFDEFGHLTPVRRLLSTSCSSGQRFAIRLPSDSQSPAKPLPSANSSPCRASGGLSPPSE